LILLLVDRLCDEKSSCARFVYVVIVGVETTSSVFGLILPSFRDIFCVVISADVVYPDYYFVDVIRRFHIDYTFILKFLIFVILKLHISRFLTSSASSLSCIIRSFCCSKYRKQQS